MCLCDLCVCVMKCSCFPPLHSCVCVCEQGLFERDRVADGAATRARGAHQSLCRRTGRHRGGWVGWVGRVARRAAKKGDMDGLICCMCVCVCLCVCVPFHLLFRVSTFAFAVVLLNLPFTDQTIRVVCRKPSRQTSCWSATFQRSMHGLRKTRPPRSQTRKSVSTSRIRGDNRCDLVLHFLRCEFGRHFLPSSH